MNKIQELFDHINLVKETKELIKEVYLMDSIPWVIGYSGGKDSTTTTQIIIDTLLDMKKEGIKLDKKVYVISSDTMVETPMIIQTIANTINGINILSQKEDLPVIAKIIRPEVGRGFWANLIGRGYPCPNQTFRWCTDRMKIEPANKFISSVVSEYGEAVMVLGVRNKESNSRDRVLESHTIKGKKLMRHTTMPNAYVFAPIRKFSVDDVWNYLLENDSPWGTNNKELFKLYSDSSEDCPMILDEETKRAAGSCGQSRFGCWVCTVVKNDKSLSGFIANGVEWLKPLRDYRDWLFSIRDEEELRMKRRSNGTLYFAKVKKIDNDTIEIASKGDRKKLVISRTKDKWIDKKKKEWQVFEEVTSEIDAKNYISKNNIDLTSGENPRIIIKKVDDEFYQLGDGPFTLSTRKEILRKLLILQRDLSVEYELIKNEELKEIARLWLKDGDWNNSVQKIYFEAYKKDLDIFDEDINTFSSKDMSMLSEICKKNNYNPLLMNELIQTSQKFSGFINRSDALKEIQKTLSREYAYIQDGANDEN